MKPANRKTDISVTIVNFNTKNLLKTCLNSVLKSKGGIKIETIVVDNASVDGSAKMVEDQFPQVKLIKNKKNRYFSKAYNQAFANASGKYTLILNSDASVSPNTPRRIFDYMEANEDVGAVSVAQIDQKGKIDATCSKTPTPLIEFFESNLLGKYFRPKRLISEYRYAGWKRNTIKQVDILPGSFILVRSSILKKLKGFDEKMVLFYSDTDLCMRLKELGYKLIHLGNIKINHLKAQTVKIVSQKEIQKLALGDMLTFYKKHFGLFSWLILHVLYIPNRLYWAYVRHK